MKAKQGFVLRHVMDEYILMPTDDMIEAFHGSVVLNGTSAFVWEKLQNDTTKEALLAAILSEYDVTEPIASEALDTMLDKFTQYGLIEP